MDLGNTLFIHLIAHWLRLARFWSHSVPETYFPIYVGAC